MIWASRWLATFALVVVLTGGARPAVAESSELYAAISAVEAYRQVENGSLLLIDVRSPDEWSATGVARRALRLSIENAFDDDDFVQQVLAILWGDRSRPLAIICASGQRSLRVWNLLVANGFSRVLDVAEGMTGSEHGRGWIASGLPVEGCALCKAAVTGQ